MNKPRVIVARAHHPIPNGYVGVYIGRPSALGNPFVMRGEWTRKEVIEQYELWLNVEIAKGGSALKELDGMFICLAEGIKLALLCYCSPKPCHGDVIKKYLDELWDNWCASQQFEPCSVRDFLGIE